MSLSTPSTLHTHIARDGFRLRGVKMARIDAFSDVVFGFALTLLVVSLEVPKTYAELHETLRGFLPFAISFLLLMRVWYSHYLYFRRFGTHDLGTVVINGALLFVVLFFVYPLKFLFVFFVAWITGHGSGYFQTNAELVELMTVYGFGFAMTYGLLAGLYANGMRQAKTLELTTRERVLGRGYLEIAVAAAMLGLLSALTAHLLPPQYSGYAGFVYVLTGPLRLLNRRIVRSRLARLEAEQAAEPLADPAEA